MNWVDILLRLGLTALGIVAAAIVGELLLFVLKPLARLLRPPHGARVLAAVWAGTFVALYLGSKNFEHGDSWALGAVIFPPIMALVATVTYRDQRREALHLLVAGSENQRLSLIGRVMAGILSICFGAVTGFSLWLAVTDGSGKVFLELLYGCAGGLLIGGLLAYAAIKGRFPQWAS